MRRRIDMTEVESATKIRGKYLRALENEEWDLLPGPTFVKTFLRTYAEYLGLDSRLLVEEYRQRFERPSTQDLTPFSTRATRGRGARRRRRLARMGPVLVLLGLGVALLGALYLLGSLGPDDEAEAPPSRTGDPAPTPTATPEPERDREQERERRPRQVRLQLIASGPVYVCLVDARRPPGDRRGDAGRGQPAAHVHQPLVPDQLRQRQCAHAREREDVPGGGERRSGGVRAAARPPAATAVGRPAAGLLLVSVRAGIVVTGTEVLVGDHPRRERAVAVGAAARAGRGARRHRGGGRPAGGPPGRPGVPARVDLVITSGGLGPTADDLTAEVVATFSGAAALAGSSAGGADLGDRLRAARALARRRRGLAARREPQAGADPAGLGRPGARRDRPGARGAGRRRAGGARAAGAAARAAADVVDGARDGADALAPGPRGDVRAAHHADHGGARVAARDGPARARSRRRRWRSPRACAAASSRSRRCSLLRPRRRTRRWSPGWWTASASGSSPSTGRRSTTSSRACCSARRCGPWRSRSPAPAA